MPRFAGPAFEEASHFFPSTTRATRQWRTRVRAWLAASGLVLASLVFAIPGLAQPADAGSIDAGIEAPDAMVDGSPEPDAGPAISVRQLEDLAAGVRALLAGTLDIATEPATLFDIDLGDEGAIRIEAERLRGVIDWADRASDTADGATADAGSQLADSGTDANPAVLEELSRMDPDRWKARVALDRARLAFYSLSKQQRDSLLAVHAQRQEERAEAAAKQELSSAERKARAANEARDKVLEEAKRAKTEAARQVKIEQARLLGIEQKQAKFEALLVQKEQATAQRQEALLRLQRKVHEYLESEHRTAEAADQLYDEIRGALKDARTQLAEATGAYAAQSSDVPEPGEDRLSNLPASANQSAPARKRAELIRVAERLRERERSYREARAEQLYDETQTLNSERLALLRYLSPPKRSAVTGFGPQGLDQAIREVRQVGLVLQYHLVASLRWAVEITEPGASRNSSALALGLTAFKWLFPIGLFVWWRRRADLALENLEDTIENREPGKIVPSAPTRLMHRGVEYLRRVRKPLEWLLLFWTLVWLLPPEAKGLLEVQVLRTIVLWTLGGTLVVLTTDFLAGYEADKRHRRSQLQTAHVRLRSLRLMGVVVVVFGLVLALTSQLVGKGTIYTWVWSVCWLAAIPVVFAMVRWWRPVIFPLIELERKKGAIHNWVLSHKNGWSSFAAAAVGGAVLLGAGVVRAARNWVGGFDLTRRFLAYLFRREISKKAEHHLVVLSELPSDVLKNLGPSTPSDDLVPSVADGQVSEVIARINAPGGGVFAIVGERGMGKTTMLQRIAKEADDVTLMRCPFGGMEKFAPRFLEALEVDKDQKLEDAAEAFDQTGRAEGAIVIDDAHRLIRPMMGGLRAFDRVLQLAKRHSNNVAWVFAFDEVIWRFFERMRGAQPLFDEVIRLKPWDEAAIVRLLDERSREVAIDPSFAHLIDHLPADADDIEREEALERAERGYYRLIWDYAAGNPGVALHTWRNSLGVDADGQTALRLFSAPEPEALEGLPDSAVFVLRALVQLERASVDDVCQATGIPSREVEDVLRFGKVRGYLTDSQGEHWVTWDWFRPITRFLQRRHLLFRVIE